MPSVQSMESWVLIDGRDVAQAARDWWQWCRTHTAYELMGWAAARLLLDAPLILPHLAGYVDDAEATINFDGLLEHLEPRESQNLVRLVRFARELALGEPVAEPVGEWMLGLDEENGRRLVVALLVCWQFHPVAMT